MQTTLGVGFLSICITFKDLVQCYLVNATYGTETCHQAPAVVAAKKAARTRAELEDSGVAAHPRRGQLDGTHPRSVAGALHRAPPERDYAAVLEGGSLGHMAMLRYLSVGLAFVTLSLEGAMILWGYRFLPRTSKRAFRLLATVWLLLFTITIYRAAVVHNTTSSFASTESGALDSPTDKALFYVFQILPEWLAVLVLFGVNVREVIGCGAAGDWRGRDETKAEKAKREAREGVQTAQREEAGVEGISAVPLKDLN
ncbi:hypothetical protein EYR40_002843 [Pleurotus pulmonarius]|nr:hypothetical protein EYR40_002843 [Pleurotus pulmonarius]